jgi:hypothetical protein
MMPSPWQSKDSAALATGTLRLALSRSLTFRSMTPPAARAMNISLCRRGVLVSFSSHTGINTEIYPNRQKTAKLIVAEYMKENIM